MYAAEKIQFEHIKFIDNKPMIDLITMKPAWFHKMQIVG